MQLRDLAGRTGMVAYEWVAEQILTNCAAARNDTGRVPPRAARQGVLADAYQLPEPQAINLCCRAPLAHVAGDFAERSGSTTSARLAMRRQGSLHADAFHFLATASLYQQDRFGEHLPRPCGPGALGPDR